MINSVMANLGAKIAQIWNLETHGSRLDASGEIYRTHSRMRSQVRSPSLLAPSYHLMACYRSTGARLERVVSPCFRRHLIEDKYDI